jgi:ABC-type glutathione transport system ATPase component
MHPSQIGALPAVNELSIELHEGRNLAIIGMSGAGKSTLARALVGLHRLQSGEIAWRGEVVFGSQKPAPKATMDRFRRDVQIVFQDPVGSLDPKMSVGEIVVEGAVIHKSVPNDHLEATAAALIERVGLDTARLHDRPGAFSGGERQRIAIARALALQPSVLILDEPTAALDSVAADSLCALLRDLRHERSFCLLLITHDIGLASRLADDVAVLHEGSLVELGKVSAVMSAPEHAATKRLLSAWGPVPPSR